MIIQWRVLYLWPPARPLPVINRTSPRNSRNLVRVSLPRRAGLVVSFTGVLIKQLTKIFQNSGLLNVFNLYIPLNIYKFQNMIVFDVSNNRP